MANWFKEEIVHFGETVDNSIQNASSKIQEHIDTIGLELNKQRNLTKSDIESLIDYAATKFGDVIDERIEKAKIETATLITEKINEVRKQLTDAATEQKRTAIINASVAVVAALGIGIISLLYKRYLHGELDLITVFRATLLALACGHGIWIVAKFITEYLSYNKNKKNIILAGAQYFGAFKVKGALGHILVFGLLITLWAVINFWTYIKNILL